MALGTVARFTRVIPELLPRRPTLTALVLFVFVPCQHKVVIGKIFGANAPELENVVADNIFPKREEE